MMSYLCENEAESIQSGDGYVAQEDAKCKKNSTGQWTMPTRLTLRKLWGSLLSILCLLGDQWKALILPGHGHAINEPLIDNNFYEYFLQFYGGVIDENFMSHCQGNTELEYHGSFRVQVYLLTSIDT